MFAKCLKYDLKSVAGVWWIAAVSVLGLSVPGGFAFRFLMLNSNEENYVYASFLSMLLVMITYLAVIAFFILTSVLVFVRFYKNFFSDEGYLTFTLPVKRKTLLLSKIFNGVLWQAATSAVVTIGFMIVLVILPSSDIQYDTMLAYLLDSIDSAMDALYSDLDGWTVLYLAEILLLLFLATVIGILMTYLCITIGSVLVRKNKVLVSVAFIYGSGSVFSFIYYIGILCFMFWGMGAAAVFPNSFTEADLPGLVALMIFLFIVVMVTLIVLLWSAILGSLERKLNLA